MDVRRRDMLVIAGLTRAALHFGNSARVVQNGLFFDSLERDIRGARHTVHIETFVWTRGELERRFVHLLCAKAAEGTKVRVVIDAMGGIRGSSRQLRRMRKCGVDVQIFCRPRWWNLRRLNHRTHWKIFIIDGRVGYTRRDRRTGCERLVWIVAVVGSDALYRCHQLRTGGGADSEPLFRARRHDHRAVRRRDSARRDGPVVIVDGAWSHIGSSNFDSRSLKVKEELSVGLLDQAHDQL